MRDGVSSIVVLNEAFIEKGTGLIRIFSTFAMAAWTGFHAVCAARGLEAAPTGAFLAAGHCRLAILCLGVAAALQTPRPSHGRDFAGLLALGGGLGLAIAGSAAGVGSQAPGAYAAAVALTLLGLAFDRRIGVANEEDEADHDAFMREAALLGARIGRERSEDRGAPAS